MSVTYLLDTELGMIRTLRDCSSNTDQHLDVYCKIRTLALRGTCVTYFVSGYRSMGFHAGGVVGSDGSKHSLWAWRFWFSPAMLPSILLESGNSCLINAGLPRWTRSVSSDQHCLMFGGFLAVMSLRRVVLWDDIFLFHMRNTIRHIGWTTQMPLGRRETWNSLEWEQETYTWK